MAEMPDALDAIYDALDRQGPDAALELITRAMADNPEAELHFLAGVALEALDRPQEAVDHLRKALSGDPEDAECRAWLAQAFFHGGRFREAEEECERALDLEDLPLSHEVKGLLLERQGRFNDADRCFARAFEQDPERFPAPLRLSREEFAKAVALAREKLAEQFRFHLDRVVVVIEDLPPDDLIQGEPPLDPKTLGLFDGAPLGERTDAELPPRIFLFQRNLERYSAHSQLAQEIAITLYHELGHYLGLEEDEVEDIGLA
jgi:predicted Zn-dependent protease with MMP-like domain